MKKFQKAIVPVLFCSVIYACSTSKVLPVNPKVVVDEYCKVSFTCEIENVDNLGPDKRIVLIFNNTNDDSIVIENPVCTGIMQLKMYSMDSTRIIEKFTYKPGPGCMEGRIAIPKKSKRKISLPYYLDELYDLTYGLGYVLECNYEGMVSNNNECVKPKEIVMRARYTIKKYGSYN